jgi:hypothetical protein
LATWREKVKKKKEIEAELEVSQAEEFQRKQTERVMAKRKMWRQKIRFRHIRVDDDGEVLEDSKVFSDSEGEECEVDIDEISCGEDPELERLFRTHQLDEPTLVVPDFNVWQRIFSITNKTQKQKGELLKLPISFQWLLNLTASLLHQNPINIYRELLFIENQYMHVYEPLELMRNVLVKQQKVRGKVSGIKIMNCELDW